MVIESAGGVCLLDECCSVRHHTCGSSCEKVFPFRVFSPAQCDMRLLTEESNASSREDSRGWAKHDATPQTGAPQDWMLL
eukprot:2257297-Amphidinium_carterae.1